MKPLLNPAPWKDEVLAIRYGHQYLVQLYGKLYVFDMQSKRRIPAQSYEAEMQNPVWGSAKLLTFSQQQHILKLARI